jgi:hypothetical protein
MNITFWAENLEGKRPLGRCSYWFEGNIKMDLREVY